MADRRRPPPKLQIRPGEDGWLALAREVVTNPDSPASLQLLSQVNQAMRPRIQAATQLTEALVAQIEQPDAPGAQAAVDAAIAHWEKACASPIDAPLLADFREDARKVALRRRRQPPLLESIVAGVEGRSDVGYQLGLDLEGLRGTWHRLWAAIAMSAAWGESPAAVEAVAAIREQFEQHLGRQLAPAEWEMLTAHAQRHGFAELRPAFGGDGQDTGEAA